MKLLEHSISIYFYDRSHKVKKLCSCKYYEVATSEYFSPFKFRGDLINPQKKPITAFFGAPIIYSDKTRNRGLGNSFYIYEGVTAKKTYKSLKKLINLRCLSLYFEKWKENLMKYLMSNCINNDI